MRVQGKHIKLFDTNTQPDGAESQIGTVFRSRKAHWHFEPTGDWSFNEDQMSRIARLLDALQDCDRGA